jgi:hypothetical protein
MKNRAFVFSTTGFLLAIPAVILVASFMVMLETGSGGVLLHIKGEKTFSLFETAEIDLDRAVEISGRRAVLATADYILTYNECLNSSTYSTAYGTGPEGAIKELMMTGNLTSVNNGVFESSLTPGATLSAWMIAFPERASSLGFNVSLSISSDDLYITAINDTWFYATLRINTTITNTGGNVTYEGTLPRTGNTTRIIDGHGVNATIFDCTQAVIDQPPSSNITSPSDGASLSCVSTIISGTATDDNNVSRVDVNVSGTWHTATLDSPGATSTNWNYTWIPAVDGPYTLCSHAVDNNITGQITDDCRTVTVSGCPSACSIILDPTCTPGTGGGGNKNRVKIRVINNHPTLSVGINETRLSWDSAEYLQDETFGVGVVWSACVANNTLKDIDPDQTIGSGGSSAIEMGFGTGATCTGNPDMVGTNFTMNFVTDQGTCSTNFYVCPSCSSFC